MSNGDGESRANRLRRRRSSRPRRVADEPSEPPEREGPSEPSEPAQPTKQGEPSKDSTSVKEEQIGTYMYLPASQKKEIERRYNVLKADYEYEFEEEFEKNRHFFPLLIQFGLEGLDGLDASDIRDRLEDV